MSEQSSITILILLLISAVELAVGLYYKVHQLKKSNHNLREQRKQSAEALQAMRERCQELTESACQRLWYMVNHPTDDSLKMLHVEARVRLGHLQSLWSITYANGTDPTSFLTWLLDLSQNIDEVTSKGQPSTGNLTTWRTEISAARLYLLQFDDRGRMGEFGSPRYFEDDELAELAHLKGGMQWIIDRTRAGNCPFKFGPRITQELYQLIDRIANLELRD